MNYWERLRSKNEFEKLWKPEYHQLAQYNSECSRGIVHTPAWAERMKIIQKDYDDNYMPAIRKLR